MDSRREPRFENGQEITITVLGEADTGIEARVVNVSAKGMCVESDGPVPLGGAVKIEVADSLVLGEVVYCRQAADGFQAGIALEQALFDTRELAALSERLLGFSPGARKGTFSE